MQSDAQQEYAAAKQAASEIRRQLDEHKGKATEFSARFMEHDALRNDLEGLETLYRETQERLAQIEARYSGKYPQVDVIERAFLPTTPVAPNFMLDALIAVVGSLVFGLFCVWLSEFLTRKEQPEASVNISSIPTYEQDMLPGAYGDMRRPINVLPQSNALLDNPAHRELPAEQIRLLYRHAGNKEKLLIALLLSGPSLAEIAAIGKADVDLENGKLRLSGTSPRTIPLNTVLHALFENPACQLTDPAGKALSLDDLNALLACAVSDADLPEPEAITPDRLRQTYIIYLVKQSLRLSELETVIGYLPPTELSAYSVYSPAGQKRPLAEINLLHPGLQGEA